jgi:predicted membrane-bound spermidine synthase
MPILILFFCSGATALVYEVIWSKYMALLFGSTIQAQTVVLAVFMGGLALGNKLFGRKADQARNPLAIYGCIEITIGVYALLFSLLYGATDSVFTAAGSHLLNQSGALLLLKGFLAMGLLLGPTILMGGTLPILAAWLQRTMPDAGRRSARFYSVNSFGAVCGAGLTGFWLVEWLGLRTTMNWSALVNLAVGVTAIVLGSSQSGKAAKDKPAAAELESTTGAPGPGLVAFHRACVMVAITGAVSMGLEVLASRCLCLIFGASLQVFAIVLVAFILGISVGSALIASPSRKRFRGEATAAILLMTGALTIGLVVFNIENLVSVYLTAQSGLNRNLMGYRFFETFVAVVSICVLGLPAAVLGSVLPLCMRAASETSDLLGNRIGRLLTWNTVGAVCGSLLTGFVLMPQIGLRGSFTTLAWLLVVAAVVISLASRKKLVIAAGVAVGIFLLIASSHDADGWRYILSAGVFRMSDMNFSYDSLRDRQNLVHLDFYEDAADATVSVEKVKGSNERSLRVNGKVDASSTGDGSTQLMLAYLPLIAKPDSKDVFCFGMGSGITAGAVLNYPIEHLTVAENCGPVLRAAQLFTPWNNGVLTNSRTRIYDEDARTALKLSSSQYDVIISEPSNPWMIGVASVFTREFYQLAANRLKPGGIMVQWFHTYEMDDPTIDMVLRTFESVFPEMEIWDAGEGDVIVLGSGTPWRSGTEVFAQAFKIERARKNLATIGLESPEAILARRMASQRTAFAIPGPGPMQRDDYPILEYAAPRAFYLYLHRIGVFRLQRFDERTWQMQLATDKDNDDLAKLDPPALKTIFDNGQGSANADMLNYLHVCYAHYMGRGPVRPLTMNNHAMLCSLQGTNKSFGVYTPPSAATNTLARELATAEYQLRSDPSSQAAIDRIKNALDSMPGYRSGDLDWSPAYYADLAVQASLRTPTPSRAGAILLRGLRLEPNSDQLLYLSRLLLREGILHPDDLNPFAIRRK